MYTRSRSGPSYGGGFKTPPVKVGEELDVSIDAVGEKGDGIATKNGFVLFVPGVKVGDKVRIRVTKVLSKVGFAEVITGSESSSEESGESSEEAPVEEAPAVEERAEDSENFGEEAPVEEESAEEAPAEEEAESEDLGTSDDTAEVSDDSGEESYSDEE